MKSSAGSSPSIKPDDERLMFQHTGYDQAIVPAAPVIADNLSSQTCPRYPTSAMSAMSLHMVASVPHGKRNSQTLVQ